MVIEFTMTPFFGQSFGCVSTADIFITTFIPSVTLPNTGCADGEDLSNQSRKSLWTVLMKN